MGPRFAFKQPGGPEFATKNLAWMTSKPYPWQLASIGDSVRGSIKNEAQFANRNLNSNEATGRKVIRKIQTRDS